MALCKCPNCNGTGRIESVAYYFGVIECRLCDGRGALNDRNEPSTEAELE